MPVNDACTSKSLSTLCAADGEFCLASRFWTGGLRLAMGVETLAVTVTNGVVTPVDPGPDAAGVITLTGPAQIWALLLAEKPPRFCNDVGHLVAGNAIVLQGDPVLYAQYYPAIMRALELLRPVTVAPPALDAQPVLSGTFDSPVGRYIHLDIEGQDHRIYFEEAGSGVPLMLQHTAGCHGSQWRHLFECKAITDHFRLIAYDLPFHGKSLPPVGPQWWSSEYKLTASFLRAVPVTLSAALGLNRPVFMGCSVGGLLALDLARHHCDDFRAVISLEGALHIDQDIERLAALWHPQVSNEFKARLMNGLMSPTSPESLRKETSQVYASGWPPVFLGDLHYYISDFDLRENAAHIDTRRVAVHILSGEYDASGTMELGQAAHAAIPGSTWTGMNDVGHFPMSENPEVFLRYLLPVLERVRAETNGAGQ